MSGIHAHFRTRHPPFPGVAASASTATSPRWHSIRVNPMRSLSLVSEMEEKFCDEKGVVCQDQDEVDYCWESLWRHRSSNVAGPGAGEIVPDQNDPDREKDARVQARDM